MIYRNRHNSSSSIINKRSFSVTENGPDKQDLHADSMWWLLLKICGGDSIIDDNLKAAFSFSSKYKGTSVADKISLNANSIHGSAVLYFLMGGGQ